MISRPVELDERPARDERSRLAALAGRTVCTLRVPTARDPCKYVRGERRTVPSSQAQSSWVNDLMNDLALNPSGTCGAG